MNSTPTILLIGCNGQVGWELQRSLLSLGKVFPYSSAQLDLASPQQIKQVVEAVRPEIIVNAAAYTAVDQAEDDQEQAFAINATAPKYLAKQASQIGALLIHYSTDYVFNGQSDKPLAEDSATDPINTYGASKLEGERAIQAAGADHLIFRTSWVYGVRGKNFFLTMLRLFQQHKTLTVVSDQIGSPTWSRFIAEATAIAIKQAINERAQNSFESGIFNLTSSGATSWHGFASLILETVCAESIDFPCIATAIDPVSSDQYKTRAERPGYSVLDVTKISQRFGIQCPDWKESVVLCSKDIIASQAG